VLYINLAKRLYIAAQNLESMKIKHFLLLGSVGVCFMACTKNSTNDGNGLNNTDQQFIYKAAYANLDEQDAAQLAMTKGDTSVRSFAKGVLTDLQTSEAYLMSLGNEVSVIVTESTDTSYNTYKQTLSNISSVHGFDSAYVQYEIATDQNAISVYQNEISNGNDVHVKNYATQYLKQVQTHLQLADTATNHL